MHGCFYTSAKEVRGREAPLEGGLCIATAWTFVGQEGKRGTGMLQVNGNDSAGNVEADHGVPQPGLRPTKPFFERVEDP